jgi:hypothetical protein
MSTSVTRISTETIYSAQTTEPAGTTETRGERAPAQTVDEVKLSAAAEAQALKNEGETVTQIAQELECTTKQIDTYLGITENTTTSSGSD